MKKILLVALAVIALGLVGCEKKLTSADIESIDVSKLDSVEVCCWEYSISWVQNKQEQSFVGHVWGTEQEAVSELKDQLTIYKRSGEISEVKYGKTGLNEEACTDDEGKKK